MDKDGPAAPDLTKPLDTEIPAETAVSLRLNHEWQLWERISEADLDDRTKWSDPINTDPMAYFLQALNR